jgi:hypothetical protein
LCAALAQFGSTGIYFVKIAGARCALFIRSNRFVSLDAIQRVCAPAPEAEEWRALRASGFFYHARVSRAVQSGTPPETQPETPNMSIILPRRPPV